MPWRCASCGEPHPSNEPPCDACGHDTFVPADEPEAGSDATVWVCTECGREHPKHNPPCSRCGNPTLERRALTVTDAELESPGYRDLLTPRYVVGLAVALVLGTVLLLGIAGVVDLPGLASGVPDVADVPGNATAMDGVSLAAVERAYVERFEALRTAAGGSALERDERLDAVATYVNQRRVKALLGDGSLPSESEVRELLGDRCGRVDLRAESVPIPDGVAGAEAIGGRLAERSYEGGAGEFAFARGRLGLDTHALPNRTVAVTLVAC